MSAFGAASPAALRSPLRNLRPEACDRLGGEEIYADAQARLVQWRKDFSSAASFEAQQGLRELCHEKEQLKDLHSDLGGIRELVQVASQLQNGGIRLAEVLKCSTDAASLRALDVTRMSHDIQASCERHRQEVQQEERKIALQQEVADAQHAEALKLLDVYKDRLGLAITRVAPQTVRMSLSLLDASDLSRVFTFTLGLADEGYSVRECMPDVPQLPKLLRQLNADASAATSLPRFVCSMRRAFLKVTKSAQ